jgi:gamma-glutamylcyclotransferase (GGCT)/AIG2-like uncharacterized protein YtfP
MSERLFVYGLLRGGQHYGHVLDGAPREGPRELSGFALFDLGRYPGAVRGPGTITGDVVEVADGALWAILDEIEGVFAEPPLYVREEIALEDGPAWIYVYDRPVGNARRIRGGDWLRRED